MTSICGVINVHREGLLAHASIRSALLAAQRARTQGLSVELLVVADCPDPETRAYLEGLNEVRLQVVVTDVDDLGLARNVAVQRSNSDFIAFLDGDDLWAANWLEAAHASASVDLRPIVWHPEGSLFFGEGVEPYWLMHPDMDDDAYLWLRLASRNLWTSLAFASRSVFKEVPYRRSDVRQGFGFEDWSWNAQTVARGFLHKIVPGSVHLVRIKPTSLMRTTAASGAMMIPTDLFRGRLQRDLNLGAGPAGSSSAVRPPSRPHVRHVAVPGQEH
jgi:glycosyltransferase involved in cell wall biosynthesis